MITTKGKLKPLQFSAIVENFQSPGKFKKLSNITLKVYMQSFIFLKSSDYTFTFHFIFANDQAPLLLSNNQIHSFNIRLYIPKMRCTLPLLLDCNCNGKKK